MELVTSLFRPCGQQVVPWRKQKTIKAKMTVFWKQRKIGLKFWFFLIDFNLKLYRALYSGCFVTLSNFLYGRIFFIAWYFPKFFFRIFENIWAGMSSNSSAKIIVLQVNYVWVKSNSSTKNLRYFADQRIWIITQVVKGCFEVWIRNPTYLNHFGSK